MKSVSMQGTAGMTLVLLAWVASRVRSESLHRWPRCDVGCPGWMGRDAHAFDDRFVGLTGRTMANESRRRWICSCPSMGTGPSAARRMASSSGRRAGRRGPMLSFRILLKRGRLEFPDVVLRADWSDGDADKEAGYAVLHLTKMPAVLVEVRVCFASSNRACCATRSTRNQSPARSWPA